MKLKCTNPQCSRVYEKYFPSCPGCGGKSTLRPDTTPLLAVRSETENRRDIRTYSTGYPAFDGVLGGGIRTGGRYSLTAGPGVGKTSFLLCVAHRLAAQGLRVLFVSAEMSPEQVEAMEVRYGLSGEKVRYLFSADFEEMASLVRSGAYDVVIVDSLQTMTSSSHRRPTYSVQTGWAMEMKDLSMTTGVVFLVINQVNRDGKMSGPMALEHDTDVSMTMERGQNDEVIIFAPEKNRQNLKKGRRCILRKTPNGPVEISEVETGNLPRHGETLFLQGVAAVPVLFGREVSVDEITATKAPHAKSRFKILGAPTGTAEFLQGVLSVRYKGITLPYQARGNRSDRIDRSADVAVVMAVLSLNRRVDLPVDAAYFGSLDANGNLLTVARMEERYERAIAQGYRLVIGPFRPGAERPNWLECRDLDDVVNAIGVTFPTVVEDEDGGDAE